MNFNLLDRRKKYILYTLLNAENVIKEKELASNLKVSLRTVRNDVSILKSQFEQSGTVIRTKSRVGIWLEGDDKTKKRMREQLHLNVDNNLGFEQQYRHRHIIQKLLLNSNTYITMQEIADELYISKATVNLDLKYVEDWMAEHSVTLYKKPNHGIKIVGIEKDLRFALASFITSMKETPISIANIEGLTPIAMLPDITSLTELLPSINRSGLDSLIEIILGINREYYINPTDESFRDLIIHLLIAVDRIKQRKQVIFHKADKSQIMKSREFVLAEKIAEYFIEVFDIEIAEDELCYITLQLLGIKQNTFHLSGREELSQNQISEEIQLVIKHLTQYIKNKFGLDLTADHQLTISLGVHLSSAVNRIKHGVNVHNPMLAEIKKKFTYAFNIVIEISEILQESFKINISENEIGFITLHLQAAIERAEKQEKQMIKTFVVCNTGMGVAQLLSIQLRKQFPQLHIQKLVSVSGLITELQRNGTDSRAELIISTIPINEVDIPFVTVNPFIAAWDIKIIQQQIDKLSKEKQKNSETFKFQTLRQYTKDEFIYINAEFQEKEELIGYVCNNLYKEGFVTEAFKNSVLEREKLSSTYFGDGIAIPHGFTEYVNKTAVCIVKLNNPIDWAGKKVNIIFLSAIDLSLSKYAESLFGELYEIIHDKSILKKFRKATEKQEFLRALSWPS